MSGNEIDGIYVLAERANRYAEARDVAALHHKAVALTEQAREAMTRSASASDPTGLVEATVRADGSVDGLYISPRAVRDFSPDALGMACVAAVSAARSAIVSELAGWLAELNRSQVAEA
jgi:hypothetical protein